MSRYSTEKKLNNVGDPINVSTVESVGACSNRAALTVTDTPEEIVIGAGKSSIEVFNSGNYDIYYGGSGVDSDNGIPIYSGTGKIWANVKSNFSVHIVAKIGENSTRRIAEYA